VTATDDEHPVETLAPDGADDALADGVGPGCPGRALDDPGALRGEDCVGGLRSLSTRGIRYPGGYNICMIDRTNDHATTGRPRLPLEKVLNLLAGSVVLTSLTLARRGRPRWRLLTGFVGANLLLSGVVGWCPTSLLLHRLGLRSSCERAHGHSSGSRVQ
jgi:hypothetical protein